jgi:hypothetical protein
MPSCADTNKQNNLSGAQSNLNLLFDVFGEIVFVDDSHSAGVDELRRFVFGIKVKYVGNAVARYPCRRIDDGDSLSDEPVEKARP